MDETPVQEALHELMEAIDNGENYTAARSRIAKKYKITPQELQNEYDNLG